jgi:hypothetical protein
VLELRHVLLGRGFFQAITVGQFESASRSNRITGKIVGILDVLALKSAFQHLIGKHDQRLAAKFPSHTNGEFLEGKGQSKWSKMGKC